MQSSLGSYIKPIDTTKSVINGVATYFVRNQRQYGQSVTTITFDDEGKIYNLFIEKVSK